MRLKRSCAPLVWGCLVASLILACERGNEVIVETSEETATEGVAENVPGEDDSVAEEPGAEAAQPTLESSCIGNDLCDTADTCVCSYSASGSLLTKSVDRGADGDVNHTESYTYDDQGNQVTAELIILMQGVPMTHLVLSYAYDEWGNRQSVEVQDGQGQVRSRQNVFYDEQHNRLRVDVDEGADGTVDTQMVYDPPCPPAIHRDPVRYNLCDSPELW